jgi:pilus assembly protein Flp/PilA
MPDNPGARHAGKGAARMLTRLKVAVLKLMQHQSGATAIEYALIAALISLLIVGWASSIGGSVSGFFTSVNNGF